MLVPTLTALLSVTATAAEASRGSPCDTAEAAYAAGELARAARAYLECFEAEGTPAALESAARIQEHLRACRAEGELRRRLATQPGVSEASRRVNDQRLAELERARTEIRSEPAGAELYVDGLPAGRTPFRALLLGRHELRLDLAGYQPRVVVVEGACGLSLTKELVLRPDAAPAGPPVWPLMTAAAGILTAGAGLAVGQTAVAHARAGDPDARGEATLADALLVTGGVIAAASLVWALFDY